MTSVADEIITAQHHTINEQADTIDRLRAALEEIKSLGVQKKGSASYAMASIARAALGEKA